MASPVKLNITQLPKVQEFLECFVADPGWVFVDMDVSALEMVVQAVFSGDPTLTELYLSGNEHDVYLYNAQFIHPDSAVREALREDYAPGREYIEHTLKPKWKAERTLCKAPTLGWTYGMGARKLQKAWLSQGFALTLDKCRQTINNLDELYAGLVSWGERLQAERRERGGWIMNGFGRPLAVPEFRERDCANAFTQSTGHDFLLTWVYHLGRLRDERQAWSWFKPVIPDYHDEVIWTCREDRTEDASALLRDALAAANAQIQRGPNHVAFTGEVAQGLTLWEFKG